MDRNHHPVYDIFLSFSSDRWGRMETAQRNKGIRSGLPVMKGVEDRINKGRRRDFKHKLFQQGFLTGKNALATLKFSP